MCFRRLAPASIMVFVVSAMLAGCAADGTRVSATVHGGFGIQNLYLRGFVRSERNASTYERDDEDESDTWLDVDGESEWRGGAVEFALWTPVVDLTTSVRSRDYERDRSTETAVGARWRFDDDEHTSPYIAVTARHTHGGSLVSDYVNGWSAGGGCLVFLSPNVFVDLSLMFESTRGLEFSAGDTRDTEVVYSVGLGVVW